MPKRRKVLIGLGGAVTLAGCTGDTDEETEDSEPDAEQQETSTEEPTQTPTEEPPEFSLVDVFPEGKTVEQGDRVEISAQVKNSGGKEGKVDVEIIISDENNYMGLYLLNPVKQNGMIMN